MATSLLSPTDGQTANIQTTTTVTLSRSNYVLLRTNVVGQSRGLKLLSLITLKPATVTRAMSDLYSKGHPIEGRPETLSHLIIEHSSLNLIVIAWPKVTARADFIEFLPGAPAPPTTQPR